MAEGKRLDLLESVGRELHVVKPHGPEWNIMEATINHGTRRIQAYIYLVRYGTEKWVTKYTKIMMYVRVIKRR